MISDSIWQPSTGLQWLQALLLPTEPWVKPFLDRMKLPFVLRENIQVLAIIHTEAFEKRAALCEANISLGYLPELDSAITQEFVTEALNKLEIKVGYEATVAFKNWAYRNFICHDCTNALFAWRLVLRHACGEGNLIYKLVPPPNCLSSLLPQIADLVSYERDRELHKEILQVSPPFNDEDGLGFDISPDAMIVEEIVRNEWTTLALQRIRDTLSESECKAAVTWAESQATEQQIPAKQLLSNVLLKSIESYNFQYLKT